MNPELKNKEIRVFSPATVANVGCGFDIFGLALNLPGDELYLKVIDEPTVKIKSYSSSAKIPDEVENNCATVSIMAMLDYLNADFGVEIELFNKIPVSSGLGSSASSATASVFALNCLLSKNLSNNKLLEFALKGEMITSGSIEHVDNIAACLYGGFILARSTNPIDIIPIPVPENLYCTVLYPNIVINTLDSRKKLLKDISLTNATRQWANIAGVIAGMHQSDLSILKRSMEDFIIEPIRANSIPRFYELKETAIENGAIGCSISGSGPSIFALSDNIETAGNIGNEMQKVTNEINLKSEVFISKINSIGPKIISIN